MARRASKRMAEGRLLRMLDVKDDLAAVLMRPFEGVKSMEGWVE